MSDGADLHASLLAAVAALRALGRTADADRVEAAMALPTSSSSELIGEIGLAVEAVRRDAGRALPADLRRELDRCLALLRAAWRT